MRVNAIKLKDTRFEGFETHVDGRWNYDDFFKEENSQWVNDWISFDCVLADEQRNTIWCGLTQFGGEIFYAYDIKSGQFRNMHYRDVGDRYDAKFHRSLLFDSEGIIWAATALLHDVDQYLDAPGGAIVRFDPDSEKIEIVARPIPHVYIQGIVMDRQRRIIYGQTFTPEKLFRYDIDSGEVTDLGLIGSGFGMAQTENIDIDQDGTVWGTWGVTRAWSNDPGPEAMRLWRYHPDHGRIEFFKHGLPKMHARNGTDMGQGVHCGPDGAMYMGTGEGLLCRVDPKTAEVEPIGKPGPARRLAAMTNGPDGKIYGTAGNDGSCIVFSYDPKTRQVDQVGPIYDGQINERAWHIHNVTMTGDGTIYAGENDVPYRSGYLWQISDVI